MMMLLKIFRKKQMQEEMIEKFDASKDTEHPMTEDEAFHAVLGYTSGYCVGLGYGPSPPSTKRDRANAECAKLKEINIKLTEDNEKLQKRCDHLEEKFDNIIEQLTQRGLINNSSTI
ncbi:hypothetical protein LINPERPRIM_LOCUS5608 [Linum perenne]